MLRSLILFLFSCGGDISIITVDKNTTDTSTDTVVNSDTSLSSTDSGPADHDTDVSNFDLIVGYSEIHFKQIACPACVGSYSEFDVQAELLLHQPTTGNYFAYMQEPGTCTTQLIETQVSASPLQASQASTFNGLNLNPVGSGKWLAQNLYEYQVERNSAHSVNTEHGSVNNAFTTIEGFDDIQPYTLLWVDPSYAFDAVISKASTSFTWTPVLPNDQFEILIAVYSPDGSQFLGAVSCLENDAGYMVVPGSYFQQYPAWSLVAVHMIRHRTGETMSPELGGIIQWHMIWEVVGTGHIE